MFDLIIKKGMAVLPDAVEMVDIAVKNGVIAAMAPTIDERAAREINALGQYVLPGMVDVHMHLSEPGRTEWEGYRTGTQAMAAGGITSFAEMPLNQIPCTTDGDQTQGGRRAMLDRLCADGRACSLESQGFGTARGCRGCGVQGLRCDMRLR